MTIVGTRPELIKMSRVIHELDLHTHHILVHTGQNYDYELNQVFFDDLDIRKPDHFLNVIGFHKFKIIRTLLFQNKFFVLCKATLSLLRELFGTLTYD